jgi:taurine dioxygenase
MHITRLAPALGADIVGLDLSQPIDATTFRALRAAWIEHLVVRIRGQRLNDPQLLAFSRHFGELDPPGPNPQGKPYLPEFPEMNVISNIKAGDQPIGGLGDGEAIWHSDMTYIENPPMAALLYAIEIPVGEGDTYWANMYAAHDSLPAALRRAIEGKVAIHDATYNSAGFKRRGYEDVTDPRQAPGAHHALIKTHPESGRACLFLGRRRNSYIVGLSLEESEALLDALWAHATQAEFTMRQQWQVGDLMIWDNRCTMHRRDSFDPTTRRLMHRTQIKGDWRVAKIA